MRGTFGLVGLFVSAWFGCCIVTAPAFALPAERHYEMVTPVFKGGFGALQIEGVSLDGEAVAFYSGGAFAGAPSGFQSLDYLARRGGSGWSTVPLMPPASLIPAGFGKGDVTPSLDMELQLGKPGPNSQNSFAEEDVFLHSTDSPDVVGGWELSKTLNPITDQPLQTSYDSASSSFCHMVLESPGVEPLVPEAVGISATNESYEFDRGCDGEPQSLSLIGLNNKGGLISRTCDTGIGEGQYSPGGLSSFNAVSTDGAEIFFTVCLSGDTSSSSPHQVFVRLDGSRTIEVSRPLGQTCDEVPCSGAAERGSANFVGASEDGSRVFFTAPLSVGQPPIVSGSTDASNNLYMATIGCPAGKSVCSVAEREVVSLTQVSHDPTTGATADVQGVVRVAPDGSRVYFVAGGDLLSEAQQMALEGEGSEIPAVGADNMYVYDSKSRTIDFIGDLCSAKELSGIVEDSRCPSEAGSDETLWTNSSEGQAQTAGVDGGFLVFATYAQLLTSDANKVRDVYRFDADTGSLVRVSGGENGYDSDGNRSVFGQNGEALGASIRPGHHGGGLREQYELDTRAISEDGSRVVFTSAEPLSPLAINGLENAYEWHEGTGAAGPGSVSLISSGGSIEPVNDVVISSDGVNVDFLTSEGLVQQDIDGASDIYDARLGGGFPLPAAERRPCEGDACQGPLTSPAPLLVPGSVSQSPGGNFAPPRQPAKPKKKAPKKTRSKKKSGTRRQVKAKGGSKAVRTSRVARLFPSAESIRGRSAR